MSGNPQVSATHSEPRSANVEPDDPIGANEIDSTCVEFTTRNDPKAGVAA
jgi:hypothetical protein